MTSDHFVDMLESGGEWWTNSWRCINCGYVLDPVLEQNRRKQQAAMAAAPVPVSICHDQAPMDELLEFDVAA
jgi:phage major head subunit gpT-like protein